MNSSYSLDRVRTKIRLLLDTAKLRLKQGLGLTNKLKGAILAGYQLSVQRTRDLMSAWMIDMADIVEWLQDQDIRRHRDEILSEAW